MTESPSSQEAFTRPLVLAATGTITIDVLQDNVLNISTTHLKENYLRRNGIPATDLNLLVRIRVSSDHAKVSIT